MIEVKFKFLCTLRRLAPNSVQARSTLTEWALSGIDWGSSLKLRQWRNRIVQPKLQFFHPCVNHGVNSIDSLGPIFTCLTRQQACAEHGIPNTVGVDLSVSIFNLPVIKETFSRTWRVTTGVECCHGVHTNITTFQGTKYMHRTFWYSCYVCFLGSM
jgi:hypothetical protein